MQCILCNVNSNIFVLVAVCSHSLSSTPSTRLCCTFAVVICGFLWCIYSYCAGFLYWQRNNREIALVPVKLSWRVCKKTRYLAQQNKTKHKQCAGDPFTNMNQRKSQRGYVHKQCARDPFTNMNQRKSQRGYVHKQCARDPFTNMNQLKSQRGYVHKQCARDPFSNINQLKSQCG